MGKAVLLVLSNTKTFDQPQQTNSSPQTGFDIKEAALAYYYFHKTLGLEINFASPSGGECYIDPDSLRSSENENEVQKFLSDSCVMQWVKCTDKIGTFDLERFQAICFIGGPGAMYDFPKSKDLGKVANYIYNTKNGVIASIGHGSAALVGISDDNGKSIIKNKNVTSNTVEEDQEMHLEKVLPFSIEKKLAQSGANFRKAPKFSKNVVCDGRIVTAQNRNSAREWVEKISKILQT